MNQGWDGLRRGKMIRAETSSTNGASVARAEKAAKKPGKNVGERHSAGLSRRFRPGARANGGPYNLNSASFLGTAIFFSRT
jgi:hypothetical protein